MFGSKEKKAKKQAEKEAKKEEKQAKKEAKLAPQTPKKKKNTQEINAECSPSPPLKPLWANIPMPH